MSEQVTVTIHHAEYIDPRAGNDKFYRVVVAGASWVTQYGRNGTLGTLTKPVTTDNPEAAATAAAKKFDAKVKKGYTPTRQGSLDVTGLDLSDAAAIDTLVAALPADASHTPAPGTSPVPTVDLGADTPITSRMEQARQALGGLPGLRRDRLVDDITGEDLPVRPMLASVQLPAVVEAAMSNLGWVAQFKYDGDRAVVEVNEGQVRIVGRDGRAKTRNYGTTHVAPFATLTQGRWLFDGELVGRTFVVFDLAFAADPLIGWVGEADPFVDRYQALTALAGVLDIPTAGTPEADNAPVVLAPVTEPTEAAKRDLLDRAVTERREGIILRELSGPYEPGRRSTGLVKVKLTKDADVVITRLHESKASAGMAVYGPSGELIDVGSVTTNGKGDVQVGEVWEVHFLYVVDPSHPRLVQPTLVRRRYDKVPVDCHLEQFVAAGASKGV